jgi:hypothetical protein
VFKPLFDISWRREFIIEAVPAAFGISLLSRMQNDLYFVQFDHLAWECERYYGQPGDMETVEFCAWRADIVAILLTISFMLTIASWCLCLYESMRLWFDYGIRGERRQQLKALRKQMFWWSTAGTVFCAAFITGIHSGLFVPAD